MKSLTIALTIVASLGLPVAAWGQKALSSAEVQQIVQQVTSRSRKTWVPAGTIQARHQEFGTPKITDPTTIQNEINKAIQAYRNNPNKKEKTAQLQKMTEDAIPFNVRYRLANGWSMSSSVTARYDNGRFYWEINVDYRDDSVKPDATLAGNQMTREFDVNWNGRRISAWDGQKYTTYSASGNRAVVDAAGKLQRTVSGPLTAGLIPWGYGPFSATELAAAQVSAQQNSAGVVSMMVTYGDGATARLTLDPTKAYAVTQAVLTNAAGGVVTYTCSDYRSASGNWVPWKITIERRNDPEASRLPTSEQWTFTSVSAAAPSPGSFNVTLAPKAVVEYSSPLKVASSIYTQSDIVDTDALLTQHLAYAAGAGSRAQNCATAALQTAAAGLGKSLSPSALARLVGSDGRTNLYEMKRFAQSQGLYCQAVKTDLAALRDLQGAKAILHFPGQNHLVVLDGVDDRDVWLVDLSSRKFYYRRNVDFFSMDWPEGTALLLSNRPIPNQSTELPDAVLADITAGDGWACNSLIQEAYVGYCDSYFYGCGGAVTVYYERWGCGSAPSGACEDVPMISGEETPCIWDPWYTCTTTGEWYYYDTYACG